MNLALIIKQFSLNERNTLTPASNAMVRIKRLSNIRFDSINLLVAQKIAYFHPKTRRTFKFTI